MAGKAPTVTFLSKDYAGNAVPMSALTTTPNRIALVMAGSTTDYGYTSFGIDVSTPGYVSEHPAPTAKCGGDGTCTYTFTHAIPAKATGTYTIGIEGRRGITLLAGTTQQMSSEYGAINKTINFSVDGSPVATRRKVVDIAATAATHAFFCTRECNQIEQCVMCQPSENDARCAGFPRRPVTNATGLVSELRHDDSQDHTGEQLAPISPRTTDRRTPARRSILGFRRGPGFDSEHRRPPPDVSGIRARWATRRNAGMCHASPSVFIGKNNVLTRRADQPGYHVRLHGLPSEPSALSHAVSQTDPKFGESCDVCHAQGTAFDVLQVHAGK